MCSCAVRACAPVLKILKIGLNCARHLQLLAGETDALRVLFLRKQHKSMSDCCRIFERCSRHEEGFYVRGHEASLRYFPVLTVSTDMWKEANASPAILFVFDQFVLLPHSHPSSLRLHGNSIWSCSTGHTPALKLRTSSTSGLTCGLKIRAHFCIDSSLSAS